MTLLRRFSLSKFVGVVFYLSGEQDGQIHNNLKTQEIKNEKKEKFTNSQIHKHEK